MSYAYFTLLIALGIAALAATASDQPQYSGMYVGGELSIFTPCNTTEAWRVRDRDIYLNMQYRKMTGLSFPGEHDVVYVELSGSVLAGQCVPDNCVDRVLDLHAVHKMEPVNSTDHQCKSNGSQAPNKGRSRRTAKPVT